jgi:hypothetical protein
MRLEVLTAGWSGQLAEPASQLPYEHRRCRLAPRQTGAGGGRDAAGNPQTQTIKKSVPAVAAEIPATSVRQTVIVGPVSSTNVGADERLRRRDAPHSCDSGSQVRPIFGTVAVTSQGHLMCA